MQEQLIHTIASVLLEISYLATGIVLCMIGNSLIKKRISSDFHAEGEFDSKKFKLITSSPGLVFLTMGMIIIIYTIITPSEFEKKVTEYGYSELVDTSLISEVNPISTGRSTSVSSILLEQQTLNNALFSKIAI